VVDLALAHIAAMDHLIRQEGGDMHVFNLGTGKGSSVLSVIQAFEDATGTALSWAFAPRRAGDIVAAYADTERAASVLGWRAQRSLADSMKDAWRWQEGLPS
jgi:UDP-glucose 4-epimerase